MGQKTNPTGLRIAVNKDWTSKWYAEKKEFGKLLAEDRKIREMPILTKQFRRISKRAIDVFLHNSLLEFAFVIEQMQIMSLPCAQEKFTVAYDRRQFLLFFTAILQESP